MRILVNWLAEAINAAPEERATVCELRFWINEANACQHFENRIPCDSVTLPAYSLAYGIAEGWWQIFGARDHDFRLIQYRTGCAIPDIRFRFDGTAFEVWADPYKYANPEIDYYPIAAEVMARPEAEAALAGFVDSVAERLSAQRGGDSGVGVRWQRVQESRADPDEAAFCEAAGALGCDPYTIADEDAVFLEAVGAYFSGTPLLEFLAGMRPQGSAPTAAGHRTVLEWLDQTRARPRQHARLPDLAAVAVQIRDGKVPRALDQTWALGYRQARAVRSALSIPEHYIFKSVSDLARRFGGQAFRALSPASSVPGVRALRHVHDSGEYIHLVPSKGGQHARQSTHFALARAVGDAVCFPETPFSVVNGLHNADRQATTRAFAAEFLAPVTEIKSLQSAGYEPDALADHFNVSSEVIRHQCENQTRIEQACL